jgi:hypothetical protein
MQDIKQEDLIHFAVAVDGEVVTFTAFPKDYEMLIAIYKSSSSDSSLESPVLVSNLAL